MKIQVNSDNTIAVGAGLTRLIEDEVSRILGRFATRLTRVEIHLSDVDDGKTGRADKRCLVEVRPRGTPPMSASTKAKDVTGAVGQALGRMQRLLTTFFGRKGRPAETVVAPVSSTRKKVARKAPVKKAVTKKAVAKKTTVARTARVAVKRTAGKKAAVKRRTKLNPRGPKKKRIYQARRKPWPSR